MKKSYYQINDEKSTLREMARLATQYNRDLLEFSGWSLEDVFNYAQSRYKTEKGEVLLRPRIFMQFGGDCDDQAIFTAAFLTCFGINKKNVYFVTASEDNDAEPGHVFTGFRPSESEHMIALDPLPENFAVGDWFGEVRGIYPISEL